MKQDFNQKIDRSNTEAAKWERYRKEAGSNPVPLWLADMDLPCSSAVRDALIRRAEHPVYGYTDRDASYYRLFADWFNGQHHYRVTEEDVILSTGVMYSITCAIRLFSREGDKVVVLSPAYAPFIHAVSCSRRRLCRSRLRDTGKRYEIDFCDLEEKLKTAKLFLMCNPHNPTGRVFTAEELGKVAVLCERYGVRIISDEIHCDITYPGTCFTPIMNVNAWTRENTIACVSPTKTFNLAGLKISAVFIKNREMNELFRKEAAAVGISSINLFAMCAVKAAYTESSAWRQDVMEYLAGNRQTAAVFLRERLHEIAFYQPEGTYFYWLDCSRVKDAPSLGEQFLKHGLILSRGEEFSEDCRAFYRLNFACPKSMLEDGLRRMETVLRNITEL